MIKDFFSKDNRFIKIVYILAIVTIFTICFSWNHMQIEFDDHTCAITDSVSSIDSVVLQDSIENLIIDEITKYINMKSPNSSDEIPYYIAKIGLSNNIDLCFIMAQTQIETNYGTAGIGKPTSKKSLFGVMRRSYNSYKHAIDDYCNILTNSYLVGGKTEEQLLKNYVNYAGNRYAEATNYEISLSKAYKDIKKSTSIYALQRSWKKLSNI